MCRSFFNLGHGGVRKLRSTQDIAPSHHQANLATDFQGLFYLAGNRKHFLHVDSTLTGP
jgi:hypothetical protein